MTLETLLLIVLLVAVLACLGLLFVLFSRGKNGDGSAARFDALRDDTRRLEAVLRDEQRAGRGELGDSFGQFRGHVQAQLQAAAERQHERIEGFGKRLDQLTERTDVGLQSLRLGLADDSRKTREESTLTL